MTENPPVRGESDSTELPSTVTHPPPSAEGIQIGPYRLLQRIGEGGMGEVWLAEQQAPVRRKVALKLIKHGMDTAQVVARFEAERQALALMDHPAVAKVFEAGSTPSGRPYFVMEYVQGVSITEHCDREKLTTRERLALFMRVCEGVQHAHQKALIHRDLKPSNVLVAMQDGRAAPKIIDFGVAKATAQPLTERTLFTELGVMIGTPEYMSPEQAGLTAQDVDTRTDVYSLGVMLYELLVGALPFDAKALRQAGFDEIRRRIREEEPSKPSTRLTTLGEETSRELARRRGVDVATLRRQLVGELDWIVMKALEKERGRRYGSAADLAAEIERHLGNLPVLAGPPSARYRAGKFVRRHRIGVGMAAAGALALVAFAAAMAWQAGRIARERDRANREARTSERALEFLTALFQVSDPGEARGSTVTAREILDRGAGRIDAELAGEPQVRAKLLWTMGRVYQSLGLYDSARPLIERSLSLRREALGSDHAETLESTDGLGLLLQAQGKLVEAEPYLRRALEGRRRVLGNDHPDTLASINNMGYLLLSQGKLKETEPYYREALEGFRRTLGNDHSNTLASINNMGYLLQQEGKLKDAEPYYREALDGYRRTLGNDHPLTLTAINNVGYLFQGEGRLAEAEPYYREALEGSRRVLGRDHPDTLSSIQNLGFLLLQQGKLEEAEPYLRQAAEGKRRVLGNDHPDTLGSISSMGYLLQAQGRLSEAEPYDREAVEGGRRVLGNDHPNTLSFITTLGLLLQAEGKLAEAEPNLREALETRRRVLGNDHASTLDSMSNLGDLLTTQRRFEEAGRLLADALSGSRRALPAGHRVIGKTLNSYGRWLSAQKRYVEAEEALLEAQKTLAPVDAVLAPKVVQNLVDLYERWGKPDKATEWRGKLKR